MAIVNSHRARRLIISALFFCLAGCAATPQKFPIPIVRTHLEDSNNKAEHDEVQVANGIVVEFYPSQKLQRRINYRFPAGGIIDMTCRDFTDPCRDWAMRITGFKPGHMPIGFIYLPEGNYLLLQTDDPKLRVIKNAETEQTIGYWVTTEQFIGVVGSYQQALAMENLR